MTDDRIISPEPAPGETYDRALRPQVLSEFVGQAQARSNLEVFITAARARGEALDHVLFVGPPGLGKTTLAHIVAAHSNAHLLDPLQLFCDSTLCYPVRDPVVMLFDPQHLTATGARSLEPQLLPDIRWMVSHRSPRQGT